MKEKLGVGKSKDEEHAESTPLVPEQPEHERHHEKKSMMEKIKEKLPGHHSSGSTATTDH